MKNSPSTNSQTAFQAYIQEYSINNNGDESMKYATDWIDTKRDEMGFLVLLMMWIKGQLKGFANKINDDGTFCSIQVYYKN